MTTDARRASGLYALFEGHEYKAKTLDSGIVSLLDFYPEGREGIAGETPARRYRLVSPYQLESLHRVNVRCRWSDHNFSVFHIEDGVAFLSYLDHDRRWAGLNGLEEVEFGVWELRLPVADLPELSEERIDQLPMVLARYERAGRPDPEAVNSV